MGRQIPNGFTETLLLLPRSRASSTVQRDSFRSLRARLPGFEPDRLEDKKSAYSWSPSHDQQGMLNPEGTSSRPWW